MKKEKRWLPWLIVTGVGIAVFFLVALYRGVFTAEEKQVILHGLCDAFFVPGILMACFGLLAFSARGGVFDMVSYGFHSLLVLFTPFRSPEKHQRYYEYKMMKELRRKKPKPYLLTVGLAFIALSVVCLVMYNRAA